jgi:hypothetical protein
LTKPPSSLASREVLPQLLSDPLYKVKRAAIPLIASAAPLNHLLFHVPIVNSVQHTLLSLASESNPAVCARISTILPIIAQDFLSFVAPLVPQIEHICFAFLCGDSSNPEGRTSFIGI